MSNILSLTKVLIKNNVFAFSGKKKKGKIVSTKGSAIGFAILIILCACMIGGPIIFVLNGILESYDLSELILSFVLPLGGFTSIIFGIFSIISVFYFSKDSEQLLPLPIKSSELLISKFLASLITEYLILIMFIFPIIFGVGVGANASFVFYIYSTIICILMPIIPSVIMAIILMLANKIFNFGKRKDMFMYIMTGLIFVFAFAYSFGLQYIMNCGTDSEMMSLLSGNFDSLLKVSKFIFPFFNSATYSLVHCNEFLGFASLMTFIGLNLLFMVVLYFVGEKLYIKGLTKDSGRNCAKKENVEDLYKQSKGGVMKELIKKEWLVIKRTPIFMLNVIIVNLIFPIVFGLSFVMGYTSEGASMSAFAEMVDFNNGGILLIVIGVLLFLCSMSSSTSSAISREGSSAWMMKTIPVSLKKQIDAKVYFSMIVDGIILFMVEILLFVIFKAPWYYFILVNIPLIIIMLISNYLSLILDLKRPRLDWKEESEAVKQNFNVFLGMMICIFISILFIVVGVITHKYNSNIYLIFAVSSLVLLVAYVGLMILINKKQVKLFSKVG